MALRAPSFCPQILSQPVKFESQPFPSTICLRNSRKVPILCSNSIGDAELAADLAEEVARININSLEREEAMKKSRELLFGEFCKYHGLKAEEVKKRWGKVDEEEKLNMIQGFVSEWSVAFHPLSSRSVKELVEEHLAEEVPSPISYSSSLFPALKRIMGFSSDNQR
ncbi:PREDICTED: uncharacterized protein LOC104595572 [Nelumbo nucifera]|uniref:Uncharacterized protein LOC104595572 n=2 Tax=Nelumbo nucifera TaxID=4432 RepID=A0A1U7ZRL4_NELNU|nr:PREDICTED: uncharacterized protein LOC104595572 [Nelumbo nucifera]DAD40841.1 TPA_asm: hypothetical protein HUJ06_015164 [Nelumbo nucifera]